QMGVHVVPAASPLSEDVRTHMKLLGEMPDPRVKPSAYEARLETDAASFDSLPGVGFNSDPAASAIVPLPGNVSGSGPVLVVDPAQNNAFKAINRAWKLGATVQASAGASGSPIQYMLRGLAADAQEEMVQSLSLQAKRAESAPGRAVRQPRIGLFQPWTGSMDEG